VAPRLEYHLAAGELDRLLEYVDLSVQQIDTGPPELGQLSESERAPGRKDHKGPVLRVDGIGYGQHAVGHGNGSLWRRLLATPSDPVGVDSDLLVIDRPIED